MVTRLASYSPLPIQMSVVYGAIIKEAHIAIYYSILVDKTPDVSQTEQITFVLRFAYYGVDKRWVVKEIFTGSKISKRRKVPTLPS